MNRKQRKRRQARRSAPAIRATGSTSGPLFVAEFDADFGGQEQAEEFRAEIRQLATGAPQKIKELQADLVDLLAPFDAFDVVANLWIVNTPKDPNTYRESDQAGLMCIPDYVALVCSQRSSRSPTADPVTPAVMDAEILDRTDQLIKSILELTDLHLAHKAKESGSSFEELRGKLVARRMFVQGPGFEFQLRELMGALFGREKTKESLLAGIGFTAEDALAISDAILEVSLRKFGEKSRSGQALRGALEEALQNGDREWVEQIGLPVERLLGMSTTERARTLRDLGRLFTFSDLGTTMQVTEGEVASESGVNHDRVKAFLEAFSTDFAQPAKTLMGTEVLRGRERPILADGEGNYLLASQLALLWSLRPALEDSLKGESGWHQFQRDRAAHVETAALNYFSSAMPGSSAYRSVSFELEEDGNRVRYEIDGLLICDTVMLVMEAKSGSLSASGRGGSPARLEKHLKEILVKASEQADRARRALDQGDCVFVAKNGEVVDLPAQVSEIFPIVVTLEDLSEVTTVIWELEAAGLLPADAPTPWALSLFELELISDLTEYAAMLIHFLRRRARLNVLKRVRASDELDWWVHYLERGLYFDRDFDGSDAPDVISLGSMTDPIDAYYLWKRGDRTKSAPKPRQKLKSDLRALLDTLHDNGQSGYIEVSVALLDLDDHGREELMRGFRRIREMTEEDGQFHNMSMLVGRDDSLGITFMTGPGSDIGRLENRLGLYSIAKKHQMRLRRWVSLGWCSGTPHLLDLVGLLIGDWHPDPERDELLREMELDPSEPMDTSDDRHKIRLPKVARRPPHRRGRNK